MWTDPIFTLGVTACNSIDHTNDGGALNCLRGKINHQNHSDTRTAFSNINNCAPSTRGGVPGAPSLWGHANEGLFVTGTGQGSLVAGKYMATWNESFGTLPWGADADIVRGRFQILRLMGCHTGAGSDGAEFLYRVAQHTGCGVQGPTGFLYCGSKGIWLEDGAVMQTATPTHKPNPIASPTPHLFKPGQTVKIRRGGKMTAFKIESIREVVVRVARPGDRDEVVVRLKGEDGYVIANMINFSRAWKLPGAPFALPTARLDLVFDTKGKRQKVSFTIYNDRICIQDGQLSEYFECAPGFRSFRESLI